MKKDFTDIGIFGKILFYSDRISFSHLSVNNTRYITQVFGSDSKTAYWMKFQAPHFYRVLCNPFSIANLQYWKIFPPKNSRQIFLILVDLLTITRIR